MMGTSTSMAFPQAFYVMVKTPVMEHGLEIAHYFSFLNTKWCLTVAALSLKSTYLLTSLMDLNTLVLLQVESECLISVGENIYLTATRN